MDFHIPTAMQLTATMTMIIGLALAFTITGYPRFLQYPMRLWVRGLLIQPFSYVLLSFRGQIPDWLSIIVANTLLSISFVHLVLALYVYNRKPARLPLLIAIVATTLIGEFLLTYVWPSLYGRICLMSLLLTLVCALVIKAIYHGVEVITRPEHLVAIMFLVGGLIMLARMLKAPDVGMFSLVASTPMQGIVFTYAALLPVIATSGFLLMCGERLNKHLSRLATLDPLTGVFNRRTMTELASKAIAASKRHGRALSLLIIDIDHFKRINDQFGHEAGDLALCRFVQLVGEVMRESDVIARLGGEEFVVILPDSDERTAIDIAERIRQRLGDSDFFISGWQVPLRVSIGVGTLGPEISDLETLLRTTDHAMYEAKRGGRNRVVAVSAMHSQSALDFGSADAPE